MMAWGTSELEWHSCPICANACPPRPPLHGPTVKEAILSLSLQLAEPHDVMCPMAGRAGNFQGYADSHGSAHCQCAMRRLYRARLALQRAHDEPEGALPP